MCSRCRLDSLPIPAQRDEVLKTVVITGASSGIGRALALLLAPEGHRLALVARRGHELGTLQRECVELGSHGVAAEALDVCDPKAGKQIVEAVKFLNGSGLGGGETVLVHGAGMAGFGPFLEQPLEAADRQIDVMLKAPISLTHALLPQMLSFGSGQVVFVGSIATRHAFGGAEAYTAAKAGLHGFARSLSESYRRQGVRVTVVTAGATDTDLWGGISPPREDMLSAKTVAEAIAGVIGLPEDRVVEEIVVTPPKGVL